MARAVVVEAGAVRRPDVDQTGTGLLHHLRDAERPADLHALAAAHRNVPPGGQRGEHEQHRGRVVVDHHRRLGPAQRRQQMADPGLTRPAFTGLQVELHGLRAANRRARRVALGRGSCAGARRSRSRPVSASSAASHAPAAAHRRRRRRRSPRVRSRHRVACGSPDDAQRTSQRIDRRWARPISGRHQRRSAIVDVSPISRGACRRHPSPCRPPCRPCRRGHRLSSRPRRRPCRSRP